MPIACSLPTFLLQHAGSNLGSSRFNSGELQRHTNVDHQLLRDVMQEGTPAYNVARALVRSPNIYAIMDQARFAADPAHGHRPGGRITSFERSTSKGKDAHIPATGRRVVAHRQ